MNLGRLLLKGAPVKGDSNAVCGMGRSQTRAHEDPQVHGALCPPTPRHLLRAVGVFLACWWLPQRLPPKRSREKTGRRRRSAVPSQEAGGKDGRELSSSQLPHPGSSWEHRPLSSNGKSTTGKIWHQGLRRISHRCYSDSWKMSRVLTNSYSFI